MLENAEKRRVNLYIILFMMTYMVSYITRINYAAIVSEIVEKTGWARTELSLALTGIFVTYGIGQLVSGYFGDHFQPKKLVFLGLLVSCAMNVLIPFCPSPFWMTVVWCVNGFAQAVMWPPFVTLMVAPSASAGDAHTAAAMIPASVTARLFFIFRSSLDLQ